MKIVAVHVLIDVAILGLALSPNPGAFSFAVGLCIFFSFGQMLLLSAWLGLSETDVALKVMAFCLGVVFWTLLFTLRSFPRASDDVQLVFVIVVEIFAVMTTLFWLTRQLILRPIRSTTHENLRWPLKYSIGSLFVLTAAVAVLLATSRVLRSIDSGYAGMFVLPFVMSCSGWLAMLPLLWTGLGVKASDARWVVSVCVASLIGAFPVFLIVARDAVVVGLVYWFGTSIYFGLLAIMIAISLAAVRRRGICLVRVDSWLTRALFYIPTK